MPRTRLGNFLGPNAARNRAVLSVQGGTATDVVSVERPRG